MSRGADGAATTETVTVPPTFSTAAIAAAEAPDSCTVTARVMWPRTSSRTLAVLPHACMVSGNPMCYIIAHSWGTVMPATRDGLASVSLGSTKEIGLRLVADGRFENLSEACRTGLRRLADDARVIDRLAGLGDEGMASGIDDNFDIDAFVEGTRPDR